MSILFVISQPVGSERYPVVLSVSKALDRMELAVAWTTRVLGASDDRASKFVSIPLETFELMIARGEFLEYVRVLGHYYGTPHKYLQQARENGNDLIVQADYSGVEQIKMKVPDAVSILIGHVLPSGFTPKSSSTVNSRSSFFLRDLFLSSTQEVFAQHLVEGSRRYDHVISDNRFEACTVRLLEIIRRERGRRR